MQLRGCTGMGKSSTLWKGLLYQLNRQGQAEPCPATYAALEEQLSHFSEQPKLPDAEWRQLINELKVPATLGALCNQQPTDPSPGTVASFPMHVSALFCFLDKTVGDGLLPECSAGNGACKVNALTKAIAKQLRSCGLAKRLPELLTATAKRLSGSTAQTQQQEQRTALAAAWLALSLYRSVAVIPGLDLELRCAVAAAQLAQAAFCYVSKFLEQHPGPADPFWQGPEHVQESAMLMSVADAAFLASHPVLFALGPFPQVMQLPEVSDYVTTVMTVTVCASLVNQRGKLPGGKSFKKRFAGTLHAAAGSGGSGLSSSSSSSSKDHPQFAKLAWDFACEQHSLLPQFHVNMLQRLGISSKTAVWAAVSVSSLGVTAVAEQLMVAVADIMPRALDVRPNSDSGSDDGDMPFGVACVECCDVAVQWLQQLQQDLQLPQQLVAGYNMQRTSVMEARQLVAAQQQQQQQLQQQQGQSPLQLHLLDLAAVLLYWVARSSKRGGTYADKKDILYAHVVDTAGNCIMNWGGLQANTEDLLHGSGTGPAAAAAAAAAGSAQLHFTSFVKDCAPLLLQVASGLLQEVRQQVAPDAAAAAAAAGGGAAGGGAGGGGAGAAAGGSSSRMEPEHLQLLQQSLDGVMYLFGMLGYRTVRKTCTGAQAAAAAAAAEDGVSVGLLFTQQVEALKAWEGCAGQVAAVFESYVRLLCITRLSAERQVSSVAVIAQECLLQPRRQHLGFLAATMLTQPAGSAAQQKFVSLLSSLLKFAGSIGQTEQPLAGLCRMAVATVAAAVFDAECARLDSSSGRAAAAAAEAEAAAAAAGDEEPAVSSSLLPWLVLFGRCCSQWGKQLEALQVQFLPQQLLLLLQREHAAPSSSMLIDAQLGPLAWNAAVLLLDPEFASCMGQMADSAEQWLGDQRVATAFAAAGYTEFSPIPQLRAAADLAVSTAAASNHVIAAMNVPAFAQLLREFGEAADLLAVPQVCNNPWCGNCTGSSEAVLVSGRSCMCGGCRVAHYCSKACQKVHWKRHKPVCKALGSAGAAGVVAASNPV